MEIGKTKKGRPVRITPKERTTHMQIIGASGKGKSKFMEHLIREDIKNNNGLCLIDPHGYLYNDIIAWAEDKGMLDRGQNNKKIVLFDPSDTDWTFGFNPLQFNPQDLSYYVDIMVAAIAKVWGAQDTNETPLLARGLTILLHALAEKKLSLLEGRYLLNSTDDTVRKFLTQDIADPDIKQMWDQMNSYRPAKFTEEFGSTINRMFRFLKSPAIRPIIGQIEKTINFHKIMDEGYILLVNLGTAGQNQPGGKITDENRRLLGTLLVNELLMRSLERPERSRPFYLYIDECGLFINKDIERIANECRKFGLHLILAHQNLAQLKKAGEDVYQGVIGGTQAKVVFGGLPVEEAETLANQLFLGELDLEEAKVSLNKPTVVGYTRTWLNNYSRGTSDGSSWTSTESQGGSTNQNASSGLSRQLSQDDRYGDVITESQGQSQGQGSSWSESRASGRTFTQTESQGSSEALMPILEDKPSTVCSLQEQIYKAMATMVNQKTQHAIVKLPDKRLRFVKTPTIKDGYARESRIQRFKEKCYNLSDYAHPRPQIEAQIALRQQALTQAALLAQAPPEPDSFVEAEPPPKAPAPRAKEARPGPARPKPPAQPLKPAKAKQTPKPAQDPESFWE